MRKTTISALGAELSALQWVGGEDSEFVDFGE
jgi:hypothetical protein